MVYRIIRERKLLELMLQDSTKELSGADQAEYFNHHGLLEELAGNPSRALPLYTGGAPKSLNAKFNYGRLLLKDESSNSMQAGNNLVSSAAFLGAPFAQFYLGVTQMSAKRPDFSSAEGWLGKSLGNLKQSRLPLALSLLYQGKFAEAKEHLHLLIKDNPQEILPILKKLQDNVTNARGLHGYTNILTFNNASLKSKVETASDSPTEEIRELLPMPPRLPSIYRP